MFAVNIDDETQLALPLGSVAADGTTVNVAGTPVAVPPGSEVFMRALRLWRLGAGALADDLLLAKENHAPLRPRAVLMTVSAAAKELGVLLTTGRATRRKAKPGPWRQRRGINIPRLAPKEPRGAQT